MLIGVKMTSGQQAVAEIERGDPVGADIRFHLFFKSGRVSSSPTISVRFEISISRHGRKNSNRALKRPASPRKLTIWKSNGLIFPEGMLVSGKV